ncbi:MAG: spore coat protein U domain-containing protein [Lysobacteraceae bacterium]
MRKFLSPSLLAAGLLACGLALAEDGYGPGYSLSHFQLTANTESECSIEIHDTLFTMGDFGGPVSAISANMWVDVTCSAGVPYEIAIDNGQSGNRRLVGLDHPTLSVEYRITQPDPVMGAPGNLEWSDGSDSFSSTGTGQLQQHPGGITLYTGRNPDTGVEPYFFPAGLYQDIITATLTY